MKEILKWWKEWRKQTKDRKDAIIRMEQKLEGNMEVYKSNQNFMRDQIVDNNLHIKGNTEHISNLWKHINELEREIVVIKEKIKQLESK